MKLPSDYLELVGAGVRVLSSLGTALRDEAEQRPQAPELWLAVRDLEGLAMRLAAMTDGEWRNGVANLLFTGQDFGVLDEVLMARRIGGLRLSDEQAGLLARLRQFLEQYQRHDFEFERPAN